ncbi:hypothetical protein EVG20_g10027 [Dentipellis fragilis]|uniref:Uncharacterized protein n=1 Tax=Dentipellis fragilis TaxID=205917 RepID=A0A4Y9XUA3_9AGAM|nr:hypothetical protein EVG20_g10027 [Dentipellis fragilis]
MLPRLRPARLQRRDPYRDGHAQPSPSQVRDSHAASRRDPLASQRARSHMEGSLPNGEGMHGRETRCRFPGPLSGMRMVINNQINHANEKAPPLGEKIACRMPPRLVTPYARATTLRSLLTVSVCRSCPAPLYVPANAFTGNGSGDRSPGPVAATATILPERRPSDQSTSGPHYPSTWFMTSALATAAPSNLRNEVLLMCRCWAVSKDLAQTPALWSSSIQIKSEGRVPTTLIRIRRDADLACAFLALVNPRFSLPDAALLINYGTRSSALSLSDG